MGFGDRFKIKEDRPTPKDVYNLRLWGMAILAGASAFMYGYDSAYIGTTIALPSFKAQFGFNDLSASDLALRQANVVSTYQCGAVAGALLAYPIAEKWGRRVALSVAGFFFTLGAAIMLVAANSSELAAIYAGRVLGGVGVGMVSLVSPIFIAEISPPAIRGRLVGLYELSLQVGGVLGFWLPYGCQQHLDPTSNRQWLVPVAIQLIPGGFFALGCITLLKESPRWLRLHGHIEKSEANLAYIRKLPIEDVYMQEELVMIDQQLERERGRAGMTYLGRLREMMQPGLRNRLALGVFLFAVQNITGINAINYYSPIILRSLGISGTSTSLFATGVYGTWKFIATLLWLLFVVDNFGRRWPLIVGGIGGALCLYYDGAYVAIAQPSGTGDSVSGAGISAIWALFMFYGFYGPSWNGTPWVVCSEIYPTNVRAFATSLTSTSQWAFQLAIARATPYMASSMGYGLFLFFATGSVLAIIVIYFVLPETKGIPMEQIDALFDKRVSLAQTQAHLGATDADVKADDGKASV